MRYEVTLPDLGDDTIASATVSLWLADEGDIISEDDDLVGTQFQFRPQHRPIDHRSRSRHEAFRGAKQIHVLRNVTGVGAGVKLDVFRFGSAGFGQVGHVNQYGRSILREPRTYGVTAKVTF